MKRTARRSEILVNLEGFSTRRILLLLAPVASLMLLGSSSASGAAWDGGNVCGSGGALTGPFMERKPMLTVQLSMRGTSPKRGIGSAGRSESIPREFRRW